MSESPEDGRQLELYRHIERHLNHGVPVRRAAQEAGMTERQFYRLLHAYRDAGFDGLGRKDRRDIGSRKSVSEELQKVIEGLCLQKPKPTLAWVHRKIAEHCGKQGFTAPSYSVVWRIYGEIPAEQKVFAHEGEKAYRHEFGLTHRWEASAPNEIWQSDHKQLAIYARDLNGRVGQLWLTAIEDDYSRAIMGYYLGIEAPSSARVALALREAIWHKPEDNWPMCGIPEKFFTDHGSDFTSNHIEQVAADLGFGFVPSQVGESEPRGKIERLFRSTDQMFLPDCKSPKSDPLDLEEIDKRFRHWLLTVYLVRDQLDLDGCPLARWKNAITIPKMPDSLAALDLMLLHVGRPRKVRRDGIRFKTFTYFDLEVSKYVKQSVSVRYDPRDMSEIYVYADGAFLFKASCKELEGQEVRLREIIKERASRKKLVKAAVTERQQLANQYLWKPELVGDKSSEKPGKAGKVEPPRRVFKYFYEREQNDNIPGN
jgi:putative transposase